MSKQFMSPMPSKAMNEMRQQFNAVRQQLTGLLLTISMLCAILLGFMIWQDSKQQKILNEISYLHSDSIYYANAMFTDINELIQLEKTKYHGKNEQQNIDRHINPLLHRLEHNLNELLNIHKRYTVEDYEIILQQMKLELEQIMGLHLEIHLKDKHQLLHDLYEDLKLSTIQLERQHLAEKNIAHRQYSKRQENSWWNLGIMAAILSYLGLIIVYSITQNIKNIFLQQLILEQQTEHDKKQIEEILESSPDAILIVGGDGEILRINRQVEYLFHYTREELIGQRVETLLPEELRNNHTHLRENYMRSPYVRPMAVNAALFGKRRNGGSFLAEVSLSPMSFDNRTVTICTVRDITAQKQISRSMMVLADVTNSFTGQKFFNGLAEQLAKTLDVSGVEISRIYPKQNQINVLSSAGFKEGTVILNLDTPSPARFVYEHNLQFIPVDVGQHFPAYFDNAMFKPQAFIGTPLTDQNEKTIGALCIFNDRRVEHPEIMTTILRSFAVRASTEILRTEAEEQLLRKTRELQQSNADLERFAYITSHDLQEPLRTVSSYVELLQRKLVDKLDTETEEFMQYVTDGTAQMKNLINDLLKYSRVNGNQDEFSDVDSEKILKQVVQTLIFRIDDNHARIEFDSLPMVKAQETLLFQLFQNLLSNALKFRSPQRNPQIRISAKLKDNFWEFQVRDNGIGFDPKFKEQIFEIFSRLQHRDNYPGTGIGLALCKRIVQLLGGEIWVESEEDKGSSFYFTVPATRNGRNHVAA